MNNLCDIMTQSTRMNHSIYSFARLGKLGHVAQITLLLCVTGASSMPTGPVDTENCESCESKEIVLIQATEGTKTPQATAVRHCTLRVISLLAQLSQFPCPLPLLVWPGNQPPWFFQSRNIYRNTLNIRLPQIYDASSF
jgi:hypothetical protein